MTVGLGSSRATLLFGAKTDAGTVYAKDESRPMVFTVEASLLDDLKKPADQLRRKDVFAFRAFNANAVEITRGGATVAFEKVKGGGADAAEKWRQTKPAAKDVDGTAMDTFLTKLSNLRAQSFVETDGKTKTGLQAPAMTVSVRFDDGRKEDKATFGREGADVFAGDRRPARRREDRRGRVRRRGEGARCGRWRKPAGGAAGPARPPRK